MTTIAFSPCPNDTFIFGPWVKGFVAANLPVKAELMDIDALNVALRRRQFVLQKVSAVAALQNLDAYEILPLGGALGFGVGPVVVGKKKIDLKDLGGKTVALPGEGTTAHFLFQLFGPTDANIQFVRYDKIIPMIQKGEVDAGVLIHEGRFILEREKLQLIADLGALWEDQEQLPLPLGVVVLQKGHKDRAAYISAIESSISYARQHLQDIYPYILEHSQEKDPEIVQKHISLYVTQETAAMTPLGERALQRFLERGVAIGIFTPAIV